MPANFTDKDMGYKKLLKEVKKISKGMEVYVGIRAEQGKQKVKGSDFTLAQLAAVLEYGSSNGHVPARPHYSSTMDEKRSEYVNMLHSGVKKAFFERGDIRKEFEKLGMRVASDVKKRIKAGINPPNEPSTIKKKGSSKPLIDTGRYWQTIDYEVSGVK